MKVRVRCSEIVGQGGVYKACTRQRLKGRWVSHTWQEQLIAQCVILICSSHMLHETQQRDVLLLMDWARCFLRTAYSECHWDGSCVT